MSKDIELLKYQWLNLNSPGYGKNSHGNFLIPILRYINFNTLLDVGTGRGEFCKKISKLEKTVYGLDWALDPENDSLDSNVKFIKADASNIPLDSKSIDITTAFDFFEHILPEEIDTIIREIVRVTKNMIICTVCTRPSTYKKAILKEKFGDGELHQSIFEKKQWYTIFEKYSKKVYTIKPKETFLLIL